MMESGVVAPEGLIAHGRGEAFDYLLGERTRAFAARAIRAAAAAILAAECPVISVNGNVAALVGKDIVRLSCITGAKIEVNLFHRSTKRERAIARLLREHDARQVLGVNARGMIKEVQSDRRRVDHRGILKADLVLVPLEDGDRTEALVALGKRVIAIDLNPLSRTSVAATISIVDNVTRAMPRLVERATALKNASKESLHGIVRNYDNDKNLRESVLSIGSFLRTR